ncbi:Fringe glycosyltransferase [Toxocara canis]|uniref:Fringe glycosyltransferase n=1 Tax=Toxocara canis TaxID=6265 RepID=A0A0B2UIR0_TOXCA|nr:Fringe glycosyltransferase [Toxocara canis]
MRRRDTLLLLLIAMLLALLLLSFKANLSGQIASSQQLRQLIDLDDVIIAIKTTEKYHESRTNDIIETWFQLAPHNIYFVTDAEDKNLNESTGYHAVVSYCNQQHTRWGCHFDDDNYVNMVELARLLKHFNANQDWYLGKPSTTGPVNVDAAHDKVQFWFATGGAGFCLSRSLLTKMSSYVRNGGFELLGDYLKLPDDVTLGYLIGNFFHHCSLLLHLVGHIYLVFRLFRRL